MTYQNLGYWIGQANDLSTGSHPSGWSNGQRWSETADEWLVMYNSSQSSLGAMTTDRDYWKTTVAHDDPNVYTNRYNAGVAAANAALPAAYQLNSPAVNANQYTTVETILRTITVNRTGYWWAACSIINADGGTTANITVRLKLAGSIAGNVVFFNFVNGGAGSGLVSTTTPVLLSNGQTITLTAQQASGQATASSALLVAGFVPTPSYPA